MFRSKTILPEEMQMQHPVSILVLVDVSLEDCFAIR